MPFNGPVIPLEQWSNITYFCEGHIAITSMWSKSLASDIPRVVSLYAGGIWKGDITTADIEELEEMDASELCAKTLNAKEVLTPMNGEKFTFSIADGRVKFSGADQVLRTSTLVRDLPDRGEGSSSTPCQDSSLCDGEAKTDFWSISGV